MRRVFEFFVAVVLRGLLGRASRPAPAAAAPRRRRGRSPAAATPVAAAPAGRPPGKRALVPLGLLALGIVLMIPFEAWFTLLAGVLALFAFIITGVFMIASPAMLDREDGAK